MIVGYVKLNDEAIVPEYHSEEAAAVDLCACLDKPVAISAGEVAIIPTGLALEIPRGYEGQVRSRSGLAAHSSVAVLNSPGTIDSDYRGEIKVILINHGKQDFEVNHGDRIAQFVIARHETAQFKQFDKLSDTSRGAGKFGSTGI